jgi:spore maturation protein SpmA
MEKISGFLGKLCRSIVVAAIIVALTSGIVRYFTDDTHTVAQKTVAAIVSLAGTLSLFIALYFEDRARRKYHE